MPFDVKPERLYTAGELAKAFDCHTATVRRYITQGKLKGGKFGQQITVLGKDVVDFIQAGGSFGESEGK